MAEPAKMTVKELKNIFNVSGKSAVVTGGGGALGQALAKGLAVYGADVALMDLKLELMDDIVAEIKDLGRKSAAYACDVSDEDSVKTAMDAAAKELGGIDILVTTAGIAGNRQPAETFDMDEWQKVQDVNVRGTLLCCKHASGYMIEKGGGKIVTIGSVRGFLGHPGGYAGYGTSKGAVHLLTKQLATEWAKHHINVNSIAPAIFWTPLTQQILDDKKMYELFMQRIPWGRAAIPDDFVGAVVYLASDASDFVTGHILSVDGGAVIG